MPLLVKVFKNAVLGMAVFGTYDYMAFELLTSSSVKTDQHQDIPHHTGADCESERSIAAHSIPVFAHASAGLCAGVAHSGALVVWDMFTKRQKFYNNWHAARRFKGLLQHSFGYAALFGTYEGVRRLLEYTFFDQLRAQEASQVMQFPFLYPLLDWMKPDNEIHDMTPVRWTFAFLAGGVAGEAHQIVTLVMTHHNPRDWRTILPKMRPTIASFALTGLCFVAFEFGGELTERALTSDQQHQSLL